MSVLARSRHARQVGSSVAVFITRNLSLLDLGHTYAQMTLLGKGTAASLTVIPCDEFGVCPEYRSAAESIRGRPAHFMGIRQWLRRKLAEAYDCRILDVGEDRQLDSAFARLAVAEGRLRTAEDMVHEIELAFAGLRDRDERLRGVRALAERIRIAYDDALLQYHRTWLASRRLSPREALDAADSSPPDSTV